MRYFLISLAVFMLLAAPSFAATSEVAVTVTVPEICFLTVTDGTQGPFVMPGTICWTDPLWISGTHTFHAMWQCNTLTANAYIGAAMASGWTAPIKFMLGDVPMAAFHKPVVGAVADSFFDVYAYWDGTGVPYGTYIGTMIFTLYCQG